MRRRFQQNDEGQLVDRNGYALTMEVYARSGIIGVVLDISPEDVAILEGRRGDIGADVEVEVETSTSKDTPPHSPTEPVSVTAVAIEAIWAFYVETMKPRRTALDPQTRQVIKDALKVATSEECIGAIRGCSKSSHHMGDNDRRKKYNTISHILRGKRGKRTTREQIDLMLTYDEQNASAARPSGVSAEILAAKRAVRQYAPFTANSHAQQLANAAMDKLKRYDITTTVTRNGVSVEISFSDEAQAA